jgi:hypothetical protein
MAIVSSFCLCSCAAECPLGKAGSSQRCTTEELRRRFLEVRDVWQKAASIVDTMRQGLTDIANCPLEIPALRWSPSSWLPWLRYQRSGRASGRLRQLVNRAWDALDEATVITGQEWRGRRRVTVVRPPLSYFRKYDLPVDQRWH